MFNLPEGSGLGYAISAITVHKNQNQTFDGSPPTYELFNLANDLHETTDLSASEPDLLASLIPLVEGTHEVANSRYFRSDDEFFTTHNLGVAAYQIGIPDGSGAHNGYRLTPTGTGNGFNYLPYSNGLNESTRFSWILQFPSEGAASFLVGGTNDPTQCLTARIDSSSLTLSINYLGTSITSTTLATEDMPNNRAECLFDIDPTTGIGEFTVGTTSLPFNLATSISPLRFWGYEIESATVQASRPRWQLGDISTTTFDLGFNDENITIDYRSPYSTGQSVTAQYSTDLIDWFDNPPGLLDARSANSQGELLGTWTLSKEGLLPRNNESFFLRVKIEQ